MNAPYIFIILTFITFPSTKGADSATCNSQLGLEFGSSIISDLSLESSLQSSEASSGRLNNPDGAWCFLADDLEEPEISFNVDLGRVKLVTGVISQGPPTSLGISKYTHHIPFTIKYGVEQNRMDQLGQENDDEHSLTSYASFENPDQALNHVWNVAIAARYIRITVDKDNTIIPDKGCLRFELLGCGPELMPNTTLHVHATNEGSVTLNWDKPRVWTGRKWAPLAPISYMIASYKDVSGQYVVINSTVSSQINIPMPFYGVYYTFQLECVVPGMQFNCRNSTIQLYPSCPRDWFQNEHFCFYTDGSKATWLQTKQKCNDVFNHGTSKVGSSVVEDKTQIWIGDRMCLQFESPEKGENCCGVVDLLSSSIQRGDNCTIDDVRQEVCLVENRVRFCRVETLEIRATSDSSVDIAWTDQRSGWHSMHRHFHVVKSRQLEWVRHIEAEINERIDTIDEWKTTSDVTNWNDIELNTVYSVLVVPAPSSGHTWANAYTGQFHLLSIGSVVSVHVKSFIQWQGLIRVQWSEIHAVTTNSSIPADEYTLQYAKESEVRNSSTLNEAKFDIDLPEFGARYDFVLFCHFGEMVIECGHGEIDTGAFNFKHTPRDNFWVVYTYNKRPMSWHDAENTCLVGGGHLTSVVDNEEYKLITEMNSAKQPFWIGGTNCGGKALKTWVDGLRWQFAAPMKSFRNDKCCLRVINDGKRSVWQGRVCDEETDYVCKFPVPSFTAPVTELKATIFDDSSVLLQWVQSKVQWQPTYFTVAKCPKDGACSDVTRVKMTSAALLTDLGDWKEYTFRVGAVLAPLKVTNEAMVELVQENKMKLKINKLGLGKLHWSSTEDDATPYRVTYHTSDNPELNTIVDSTKDSEIVGLRFNTSYTFDIVNKNKEDEKYSITTASIPTCDESETTNGELCYKVTSEELTWDEGKTICEKNGARLADGKNLKTRLLLSTVSTKEKTALWYRSGEEDGKMCLKVIPDTQDVINESCEGKLRVICEKKVEGEVLPVRNLQVQKSDQNSINVNWDPPNSWHADKYKVTLSDGQAADVTDTNFKFSGLKPAQTYTVTVTPVALMSGREVQGKTEEIQATLATETTRKLRELIPTTEIPTKRVRSLTTPGLRASSEEQQSVAVVAQNNTIPENLKTFHIIGCATLIGCVSLSILAFLICGMYSYRDVCAQMGFEVSILVAHSFFLIWAVDNTAVECKAMSITVHFFFTAAYTFLLLEAIAIAKATTNFIPITLLNKWWHVAIVGWIPAFITIGASVGFLMDEYPTSYPCWLLTESDVLYANVIPIGILGVSCALCLAVCICFRPSSSYEVDEESYSREKIMQVTRWVVLILLILTTGSWVCGVIGMENGDETNLLIFIIANILSGVTVIVLRCLSDSEVRQRLKSSCAEEKVYPEDEDEEYMPKKVGFIPPYKEHPPIETIEVSTPKISDKTLLTEKTLAWDRYVFRP